MLFALLSFENKTAHSVAIIRKTNPRMTKTLLPKEIQDNNESLHCLDPTRPCKCVSKLKTFTDEQFNKHNLMTHSCTHDQDADMFDRMKGAGVNLECKQIHTTLSFVGAKDTTYNSGCELRFTP